MTRSPLPGPTVGQHARALADPTRRRIFETISASVTPLDIPTLTEELGAHHTTVRSHLAQLRDAGLVVEEPGTPDGPGRPRLRYRVTPDLDGAWGTPDRYRNLALLLADALRTGSPIREVGRRAATIDRDTLPDEPLDAFLAVTASQGFEPALSQRSEHDATILLTHCPFSDVAATDPATVCDLHRGLVEESAHRIGGIDVEALVGENPHTAGCHLRITFNTDRPTEKRKDHTHELPQ